MDLKEYDEIPPSLDDYAPAYDAWLADHGFTRDEAPADLRYGNEAPGESE